ncbi:MAG: hypothetical protein ACTSU2_07255, partial [Promethearchaeota archaeon]
KSKHSNKKKDIILKKQNTDYDNAKKIFKEYIKYCDLELKYMDKLIKSKDLKTIDRYNDLTYECSKKIQQLYKKLLKPKYAKYIEKL